MRVGIVVNALKNPKRGLTTFALAAECVKAGHEVWVTTPGRLAYDPDDHIRALAHTVRADDFGSPDRYAELVASDDALRAWVDLDDLDVLLLRNNPPAQTAWAQQVCLQFGRVAARRGVLVLNDPDGLAQAMNKLYLLGFPESVRPRTLVTRDRDRIVAFLEDEGRIVVKPLAGYGGTGVFVVDAGDTANLDGIIRAVSRDGYVVAQAYLPAAEAGDLRLFLLEGRPLRSRGRYAAAFRRRTGPDIRSNVQAGGRPEPAEVDDRALAVAEALRPRLVDDGMFLVGLDLVGDKVMEINVFSPGGLSDAGHLAKVNFLRPVREALERRVSAASG